MPTTIRHTPRVGDWLIPDQWDTSSELKAGDDPLDHHWAGCQFRVYGRMSTVGVNLRLTGAPHIQRGDGWRYKSRVKIEFVGDGEPSTFSGGWLCHDTAPAQDTL